MRESERLRARLDEITALAETMTFRAEGTVAQEAPALAADAIAALERSEEDRAAMQAVVDAAGDVCRLGPAADWQRLDLALLALHRVRKAREGGAA